MKKRIILIASILIFIVACSKKDDVAPSASLSYKQFVSLSPSNPLLLRVERNDNTIVEYYGEKNSNGEALSCNLIGVKTPEYQETIYTEIDSVGRPTKVFSYDGSSISFNYENINDIRVEVITSNGENRLNFPLKDYNRTTKASIIKSKHNERNGRRIKLLKKTDINNEKQISCDVSNLRVNLDKCNKPFDYATVILLAKGVDEPSYQARYQSRSDGNGSYCFLIDKPEPSSIKIDDICKSVESVLGTLCMGVELVNNPASQITLCTTISAAFSAAGLSVFLGCEALINAMNIYCSTLGASPGPSFPSILSEICSSSVLDENVPTEFTFKPAVYIDGGSYFLGDETNKFPTMGPFTDIDIVLPSTAAIADFSTEPLDPEPEVDYVATAIIECLDHPSSAVIKVVGTDQYTDSIALNLPVGNSTISLSVPGAEGGVKDYLSIDVQGLSKIYKSNFVLGNRFIENYYRR